MDIVHRSCEQEHFGGLPGADAIAAESHDDMSNSTEEFARYAEAERQLHDMAAPVLATIIRAIEARRGVCIDEVRVTVDHANRSDDASAINCTIIRAHLALSSDVPDVRRPVQSVEPLGGGLSSDQGQGVK
jgi:hypothetical protein